MAKRGRQVSLDGLVARLGALDRERADILSRLSGAVSALGGGGETVPSPFQRRGPGRPPGSGKEKSGRKRKFKMSAEGRAKIAAAQRARWAKVKRRKKKATDGHAVGNG